MQATALAPSTRVSAIATPQDEDPYLRAASFFKACEECLCKLQKESGGQIDPCYLRSMRNLCQYGTEACGTRWDRSVEHSYRCLRDGLRLGEDKGLFVPCQNLLPLALLPKAA